MNSAWWKCGSPGRAGPLLFVLGVLCAGCASSGGGSSKSGGADAVVAGELDLAVLKQRLEKSLGPDWKLDVWRGLSCGDWKHGCEVFGVNESLAFEPPGPHKSRCATLQLYLHPLTVPETPGITMSAGSLLSQDVGETDTHRVYGGDRCSARPRRDTQSGARGPGNTVGICG